MSIRDTVKLWRNAIRLVDGPHKAQRKRAKEVLEAVKVEWSRRGREKFRADEVFSFPLTDAPRGLGTIDTTDWSRDGVLSVMGYRVGADGETKRVREKILHEVFSGPLPPAFSDSYLKEWGQLQTVIRLQKLAETVAALTRNAKRRRTSKMDAAIRDWEADLEFLYYQYYQGKYYFIWPETSV